jgi:hypothetical protein
MRPKHVLWLAAAVLCSTWYAVDPQARIGEAPVQAAHIDDPEPVAMSLRPMAQTKQAGRLSAGL